MSSHRIAFVGPAFSVVTLLLGLGCGDSEPDNGSQEGAHASLDGATTGAGGTMTAATSNAGAETSASTNAASGAGPGAGAGGSGGEEPPPPQIVYVNFDGAVISDCANYCSDAPSDQSWAISEHFGETQMTFSPYTDAAGKTQIVQNLEGTFAPYNVAITTTRPAAAPYTMVIISPTPGPHHGVSPLDCENSNPNDIAFVYNLYSSTKWSAPQQISQSAAHELGHSFGLEHVVAEDDFMQWASSGNSYTISTYDDAHPSGHDCIADDTQDAPAMLLQALGPAP
jgi:hypothetical protein